MSSAAISRFKHDQAFDFNELINSEAYSFSSESREILLLNYEVWFKFICSLEKIFISRMHTDDTVSVAMHALSERTKWYNQEIGRVIFTHPELFNVFPCLTKTVMAAHSVFVDYIARVCIECANDTMYTAFPKIVLAVSNSLHNLLFVLHEMEHVKAGKECFLSLTDTALDILDVTGVDVLEERAKLYRDAFSVREFRVKDYTEARFDNTYAETIRVN